MVFLVSSALLQMGVTLDITLTGRIVFLMNYIITLLDDTGGKQSLHCSTCHCLEIMGGLSFPILFIWIFRDPPSQTFIIALSIRASVCLSVSYKVLSLWFLNNALIDFNQTVRSWSSILPCLKMIHLIVGLLLCKIHFVVTPTFWPITLINHLDPQIMVYYPDKFCRLSVQLDCCCVYTFW